MSRRRWVILVAVLVVSAGVLAWIPVLDVDGDGLSVVHESQLGTDPLAGDSDEDGLADDEEIALETDPLEPDTDGDGIEDGSEVDQRIDPAKADTDGDGLDDGEELFEFDSDPRNGSASLVLEPTSLNFVEADGGAATKTVVVRNGEDANGPLEIEAVEVVGRDAAAYTVVEGGEPTTLNPGESTEVVVRFEDPGTEGDNYASLRFTSNDDERPQADVWLADTPTTVEFETRTARNRTSVAMAIGAAQAGSTIALNITRPTTRNATAGVDAIGIRVGRESDLALNVTSSTEPLPEMPDFEVGNNTSALGHFRVDHTIGEGEVESGWFRFRIAKSEFPDNNTRPENVVLYRYADGEWNELEETELVGETGTHYVFRAETPGFSDFTAGVKQPRFEISEANVDVDRIQLGESVAIEVRITNTGEADGRFTAKLVLNGEVVNTKTRTIAVNGTSVITFEREFTAPGEYEVRVNDEPVGEIVVEGTPTDEEAGGIDPLLIGGALVGLLALLGVGVLLRRRRGGDEAEPAEAPASEPDDEESTGVFREPDDHDTAQGQYDAEASEGAEETAETDQEESVDGDSQEGGEEDENPTGSDDS